MKGAGKSYKGSREELMKGDKGGFSVGGAGKSYKGGFSVGRSREKLREGFFLWEEPGKATRREFFPVEELGGRATRRSREKLKEGYLPVGGAGKSYKGGIFSCGKSWLQGGDFPWEEPRKATKGGFFPLGGAWSYKSWEEPGIFSVGGARKSYKGRNFSCERSREERGIFWGGALWGLRPPKGGLRAILELWTINK